MSVDYPHIITIRQDKSIDHTIICKNHSTMMIRVPCGIDTRTYPLPATGPRIKRFSGTLSFGLFGFVGDGKDTVLVAF